MLRTTTLIIITLLGCWISSAAQNILPFSPSDSLTVSLLTAAPGREVYQLDGHTALRIQSPEADVTVNWGVFDFDAPGFVFRFMKGETDYLAAAAPTDLFLAQYARVGRRVDEQVLLLDSVQKARLVALVDSNLRPENRVYRYNYIRDNCATRPLDIIDLAMADTIYIQDPLLPIPRPATFRTVMTYYHRNYPWYQFGIDLALGSGIDHPLSVTDFIFSPVALHSMMKKAVVVDNDPGRRPLVGASHVLLDGPEEGTIDPPTPFLLSPMFVALLILAGAIIVTVRQVKLRRYNPWFDAVFYSIFALGGCVVAFLVFVSVHEATSPNFNLLWLNPLLLAIPVLAFTSPRKWLAVAQGINLVGLIAYAVVWLDGIQFGNPAFIPLLAASAIRALACILLPLHHENKKDIH